MMRSMGFVRRIVVVVLVPADTAVVKDLTVRAAETATALEHIGPIGERSCRLGVERR
jgi:hypothetical protein